jgi:hypothetical protein
MLFARRDTPRQQGQAQGRSGQRLVAPLASNHSRLYLRVCALGCSISPLRSHDRLKLEILRKGEACTGYGELGALLRKEGL